MPNINDSIIDFNDFNAEPQLLRDIQDGKAIAFYSFAHLLLNADGTPYTMSKGIQLSGNYDTLNALKAAFPKGNSNLYIVNEDSKIYYWNGADWVVGGGINVTYASTLELESPAESTSGELTSTQLNILKSNTFTQIKLGNFIYRKQAVVGQTKMIYKTFTDDHISIMSVNMESGSWTIETYPVNVPWSVDDIPNGSIEVSKLSTNLNGNINGRIIDLSNTEWASYYTKTGYKSKDPVYTPNLGTIDFSVQEGEKIVVLKCPKTANIAICFFDVFGVFVSSLELIESNVPTSTLEIVAPKNAASCGLTIDRANVSSQPYQTVMVYPTNSLINYSFSNALNEPVYVGNVFSNMSYPLQEKYLNPAGGMGDHEAYSVSDYYDVANCSYVALKDVEINKASYASIVFYSESKTYISGNRLGTFIAFITTFNGELLTFYKVPKGSKFIRISAQKKKESLIKMYTIKANSTEITTDTDFNSVPKKFTLHELPRELSCFLKVGCIGDSLASGESVGGNSSNPQFIDIFEHSWGQYLARLTGNKYLNLSQGGMTTKTWYEKYATNWSNGTYDCQAYIIGLGVNDQNHLTLGSAEDVDSGADTYYGWYGKIIKLIQGRTPKAKIFVLTMPQNGNPNDWNEAIKYMANKFSNVYAIDLNELVGTRYNEGIIKQCMRYGHYNAIGYMLQARIIASAIDYYIETHLNEFLQIEFINTDNSWQG